MKIRVSIPSRSRPLQLRDAVESWHARECGSHPVEYVVANDVDDPRGEDYDWECSHLRAAGCRLSQAKIPPGGKVAAFNAAAAHVAGDESDWDVLVAASDDFQCAIKGWDEVVSAAMDWHFPARDGLLIFNDGCLAETRVPTMPVMGRRLWDALGREVFSPAYRSFFCDDELGRVCALQSRVRVIDIVLARHLHGGKDGDDLYAANHRDWPADQATYAARKSMAPAAPLLSICVPTLWSRREQASRLFDELYRQIKGVGHSKVELLTALDQKRQTVGAKRGELIRRSRGKFVCFVDDDDWVADDYISTLVGAIESDPKCDCVVFRGHFEVDGAPSGVFDFDLRYHRYRNLDQFFERTPNHLCPIRRQLAVAAGFPDKNCSEDTAYAQRVRPLLRSQAECLGDGGKKLLYFYRFSPAGTQTQRLKASRLVPA